MDGNGIGEDKIYIFTIPQEQGKVNKEQWKIRIVSERVV